MAEELVGAIRYSSFLFQMTPSGVIAEPQEIAVLIGHLARYADLVEVEIGEVVAALAHFAVGVVTVVVLAHQFLTIEGDEVRRCAAVGRGDLVEFILTQFRF